jgi:hypothetical protein
MTFDAPPPEDMAQIIDKLRVMKRNEKAAEN